MQGWTGTCIAPFLLLQFAGHRVIPIHERSLRIVAPCPDMQFEERIQVEPVRRSDELKILSVEGGWNVVVRRKPRRGVHDVLDPYQAARVPYRFVNQRLWMLFVNLAIADKGAVDVVNAHR